MKNLIIISNNRKFEFFLGSNNHIVDLEVFYCNSMQQATMLINNKCCGIIINSETLSLEDLSLWYIMKQKNNVPITFISNDEDENRQMEILQTFFSICTPKALYMKNSCSIIRLSDAVIFDLEGKVIWKDGIAQMLTMTEYKILCYLLECGNCACNIEHIIDEVWGIDTFTTSNSVYVHIRKLREKIENDPSDPKILVTCHGIGYRINLLSDSKEMNYDERVIALQ